MLKRRARATFWPQQHQINRNNVSLKNIHSFCYGFVLANSESLTTIWKLGFSLLGKWNAFHHPMTSYCPQMSLLVPFLTFEFLSSSHWSVQRIWSKMELWKGIWLFRLQTASLPEYFRGTAHPTTYPDFTPTQPKCRRSTYFLEPEGRDRRSEAALWGTRKTGHEQGVGGSCFLCRGHLKSAEGCWGCSGKPVLTARLGEAGWCKRHLYDLALGNIIIEVKICLVPAAILEFRGSWSHACPCFALGYNQLSPTRKKKIIIIRMRNVAFMEKEKNVHDSVSQKSWHPPPSFYLTVPQTRTRSSIFSPFLSFSCG